MAITNASGVGEPGNLPGDPGNSYNRTDGPPWTYKRYGNGWVVADVLDDDGMLSYDCIPMGSSASTVCVGNDSRLSNARTPTPHTHVIADITDYEEGEGGPHNTTHQNGGSDEINVGGLSGVLADPQTPIAHATQHVTGNDVIPNAVAAGNAGLFTGAEKSKLDGIAGGATVNSTDASLRDRATHTGSQAQSTITNLTSDLANKSDTSHTHSLSAVWPVGSVFISVVSTNPATLLGFGTWSAFAAGRVLVGIDAGQTEFDTLEETGGAKTHTLTSGEMPAHTHVQDPHTFAGRILKPGFDTDGYLQVVLCKNGIRDPRHIHHLVAAVFVGPRPDGFTVNHIDTIKTHNFPTNLEYLSNADNVRHAFAHGLMHPQSGDQHWSRRMPERVTRGLKVGGAKLSNNDLAIVREMIAQRIPQRVIGAKFGVSQSHISSIKRGRRCGPR